MHSYAFGLLTMIFGLIVLVLSMFNWWFDLVIEATFEGEHTKAVQSTYRTGFILFVLSELMLFVAFFWCDFHFSLNPNIWLGVSWPVERIADALVHHSNLSGLMTLILITSSVTLTISHHALVIGHRQYCVWFLGATIVLGLFFTLIQYSEYVLSSIAIDHGIYGSTLYLLTGFHGLHVIIGNIFLITCFVRFILNHFTIEHHVGFVLATFYWHFVDFIWLIVYSLEYVTLSPYTDYLHWYLILNALKSISLI